MSCTHHWVLPSDGAVVRGSCIKCGAEREFNTRLLAVRKDPLTQEENAAERRERFFESISYRQAMLEVEDRGRQ